MICIPYVAINGPDLGTDWTSYNIAGGLLSFMSFRHASV